MTRLVLPRRSLLLACPALALSGAMRARAAGDPFTLGVASGEPAPDGVVLWTRLAPEPLNGGGMGADPVAVEWVVAEDPGLRRVVQRGRATALAEDAHSVHVELSGLRAGAEYFYRFAALGAVSPVGRTRTAPAPGSATAELRLAVASCQQYEHGFYGAHRHIARAAPDAVLFLGDYIYEASWGRNLVRRHGTPTAMTLEDYRNRHALYRSDPDLQAAHAAAPWIVTWDDHEVSNDYARDIGERLRGAAFLARRAAGYRAFWEHMPLPASAKPRGPDARIFRRAGFGRLAQIHVLDDRQYRDAQACQPPDRGGATRVTDEACPQRLDPARSMLGTAQENWLQQGLAQGGARWTIVAQQTRMARFGGNRRPPVWWTDGWDGYPAARRRLLEALGRQQGTPLVLGGDIHAFLAAELRPDFDRTQDAPAAVEFVAGSVTSQGGGRFDLPYADDPHILYGDGSKRGWLQMRLTPREAIAEMMALDDPADAATGARVMKRWAVEAGRAKLLEG
jgi:alkaline phosphatase D